MLFTWYLLYLANIANSNVSCIVANDNTSIVAIRNNCTVAVSNAGITCCTISIDANSNTCV